MKKKNINSAKVRSIATPMSSAFDPNGSYTGNSSNGEIITGRPVQDADDL